MIKKTTKMFGWADLNRKKLKLELVIGLII